jgi:hypothetical protein
MRHKHTLMLLILFAMAACTSPNKETKAPAEPAPPPVRETSFKGYLNTDIMTMTNPMSRVLICLDPATMLADEAETPGALAEAVAANASDLRKLLPNAMAFLPRMVTSIEKKPITEMVFLTVFPFENMTLAPKQKNRDNLVRAKPGKLTHLAQVVIVYGAEREHQVWKGPTYQDVAMEGTVNWWGNVGLKAASDGTITHLLLRAKPEAKI